MKIIDFDTINSLNVLYSDCVDWVESALILKSESKLPAKISLKLDSNIFFNTMPCYIPDQKKIGVKLVSRYPLRVPSLISEILLYDSINGETLALMNADWITAMRTGAVAALSIKRLQSKPGGIYSFVGLGNTARATLLCLLSIQPNIKHHIRILEYKDQCHDFIMRFKEFKNISFEVVKTNEELVDNADVIISCVTAFDNIFADDKYYKKGVLLIPVHTRGFQNCDLFFDKIFGDDYDHIKDFKYFNQFKEFAEFSEILTGKHNGRESEDERIIAYNIGIALHDVYFASKIYDKIKVSELKQIDLHHPLNKFWI